MVLNLTHFERQSLTQTFPHASSGCHVTGGGGYKDDKREETQDFASLLFVVPVGHDPTTP